jgi:ATP-dependent Lhr-like helicase
MLKRINGHLIYRALEKVSPLSVAVLLEIGREAVYGEAAEDILADAEQSLLSEAIG